jgi:hypothetical protein
MAKKEWWIDTGKIILTVTIILLALVGTANLIFILFDKADGYRKYCSEEERIMSEALARYHGLSDYHLFIRDGKLMFKNDAGRQGVFTAIKKGGKP